MKVTTATLACALVLACQSQLATSITLRGEMENSMLAGEEARALDSWTQNSGESFEEDLRAVVIAGLGELPGGSFAQLLVSRAWPSKEQDLWEVVKAKFTYLLTSAISTTILTAINSNAGSVAEKVGYFKVQAENVIANPTTYSIHDKLQDALSELVTLRNTLDGYNTATDDASVLAVAQLIPLTVGTAVSEMALRRFQYNVCHDTTFTQTANGKTTNMYDWDADGCSPASVMVSDMTSILSEWMTMIQEMYPKWYAWRRSKFSTSYKCWIKRWNIEGSYTEETRCNCCTFGEYTHFDKTGEVTDSLLNVKYDIKFEGSGAFGDDHMKYKDFENCLFAIRERFMTQYALEMQIIMSPTWILRRTIPGYRTSVAEVPSALKYTVVGPVSSMTARDASASHALVTANTKRFPTSIAVVTGSYTGTYGEMNYVRVYKNDAGTVLGYKFNYKTANLMSYGPGHWKGWTSYYDAKCSVGWHMSGIRLAFGTSQSQVQPTGSQLVCTDRFDGDHFANKPTTGLSGYSIRASGGRFYRLQGAMVDSATEDYTQAFIFEYVDPEGRSAAGNMEGLTSWASSQSTSYVSSDMRTYFINAAKSFNK